MAVSNSKNARKKLARRNPPAEVWRSADRLGIVRGEVLASLGIPPRLYDVQVHPLWSSGGLSRYRVNVRAHVDDRSWPQIVASRFLVVREPDGEIVAGFPGLFRIFGRAAAPAPAPERS